VSPTAAPTCDNWEQQIDCPASITASQFTDWEEKALVLADCEQNEDDEGNDIWIEWACTSGELKVNVWEADDGCSSVAVLQQQAWESPDGTCVDSCTTLSPTASPVTTGSPSASPVAAAEDTTPSPTDPPSDDGAAVKDIVLSVGCALFTLIVVHNM